MRVLSLIAVFAAAAVFTGLSIGGDAVAAKSCIEPGFNSASRGSADSERLAGVVAGKRGDGLVSALRRECRLKRLCDFTTVYDGTVMTDPYTGTGATVGSSLLSRGLTVGPIVPSQWWTDRTQGADNRYDDTVARDLHNLALYSSAVFIAAGTYPPGIPQNLTADHGSWRQGTIDFSGINVAVNEPCESQRGRVARAFLYMALMYPQAAMAPEGLMVMTDGGPSLNDYWRSLLLGWHERYPPDASEKECAQLAMSAQGGYNPLILLPDIAGYIWGDKRDEIYGGDAESGSEVPLHGVYSLSEQVTLASPHVPDDALWSIDGKRVAARTVAATSLGAGDHDLEYVSESTGEHGRVKITIKR